MLLRFLRVLTWRCHTARIRKETRVFLIWKLTESPELTWEIPVAMETELVPCWLRPAETTSPSPPWCTRAAAYVCNQYLQGGECTMFPAGAKAPSLHAPRFNGFAGTLFATLNNSKNATVSVDHGGPQVQYAPLICTLLFRRAVFSSLPSIFLFCQVVFLLRRTVFLSAEHFSWAVLDREAKLLSREGKVLGREEKLLDRAEKRSAEKNNTRFRRKTFDREEKCSA